MKMSAETLAPNSIRFAGHFFHSPVGLITFFFLLSRIIYLVVFRVTFNADGTLGSYWQFIDPELLKHDLWNSLYYLHFEPPLFNAFLGIVLKCFPIHYAFAFQLLYLLMGYAFSLTLYHLMLRMQVQRGISLILTLIHTIHPATVLYENWLFYACPTPLFLCISALCLCRFLETKRYRDGVVLFGVMAFLVYLNNFYTPWWFLFCVGILIYCCKMDRRIVIRSAMVPLLLVIALLVKQEALFGKIQISPQFMMGTLIIRVHIPPQIKESLAESGELPAWCLDPFREISIFSPYLGRVPLTGIPVLDQEKRSTGAINFNHSGYLKQFDICMPSFLRTLWKYPQNYLDTFDYAITRYFVPASDDYGYVHGPYYEGALKSFTEYVNLMLSGQFQPDQVGWFLVIGFPLLTIAGCIMAYLAYRHKSFTQWISLVYILFNIFYATLIIILITAIEQNRYRLAVDSYYLVLLGMCLTALRARLTMPRMLRSST